MNFSLFPELNLVVLFVLFLGGVLCVIGVRRLIKRKYYSGSTLGLAGSSLIALSILFFFLILNLYTYQRFTHEAPVAQLTFSQTGDKQYRVELQAHQGETRSLDLNGDEWQLDSRIIKWTGVATLLGLDTVYRMERISGRYKDIRLERSAARTVYDLSVNNGVDVWELSRQYQTWLPWADAVYGSATYLPMRDGAKYKVSISTTGLVARPDNKIAKEAIKRWR